MASSRLPDKHALSDGGRQSAASHTTYIFGLSYVEFFSFFSKLSEKNVFW